MYELYTDGGYSIPADLGAFAYVILQDGKELKRNAQKIAHETSNRAEIKAIMEGVRFLPDKSHIKVYSDSQYAIGVLSGKYKAKANTDLVYEYKKMVRTRGFKVEYRWVRGHNGNKWNELCDTLCNEAAGIDLNSHRKKDKDLSAMTYNDLMRLYKAVREELYKRLNEEPKLLIEKQYGA